MASTPTTRRPRPLAGAVRFGFFIPLAVLAGCAAAVLALHRGASARLFAWTFDSPVTAVTMAAGYVGGFALLAVAAAQRSWVRARLAYVWAMLLLVATLAVTLARAGGTHLGGGDRDGVLSAWVYVLVQALAVVVGVLVLRAQDRAPAGAPAPGQQRRWHHLAPIVLIALAGIGFGAATVAVPARLAGGWPWPVSTMDVRGLGIWAITLGLGSVYALWEADLSRLRPAAATYLITGVAGGAAAAWYAGTIRWSSVYAWVYVAALAVLVLVGLAGLRPDRAGRGV